MSNIIDSIQLSGVTYQIQGSGGGGVPESTFTAYTATTDERISQDEEVTAAGLNALNDKITPTVELTQAQYDALVTAGTVAQDTYYIITDAQAGDLTNYYTKSETNTLLGGKANTATTYTKTEVDTALGGKQATLVSGTNIKTINNESLLGSGNINIQGGSTYTAGRGISIANDAISVSLPISAGTGSNSIAEGDGTTASGIFGSHAEGYHTRATGWGAHAEGSQTAAIGNQSHAEGFGTIANNLVEHASGQYNVSSKANNTFGDSGNTLFSVGNGTSNNAKHNAFEIRQNGDIYLTKDGQDVKLQDHLGGSSITVDSALSSTSENPVQNKVIYNKINEVEQVTAAALNTLNDAVSGKADTSAVTEVSDALTAHTANTTVHTTAAEKTSWNGAVTDIATVSGQVSTNTTNIATVSAATTANTTALGGLKLVKLTQAEYDVLATKDSSTLYIIVN